MAEIKNFVLAYEPSGYGVDSHYIIDFKLNEDDTPNFKLLKVEKYKGIVNTKKGRHTLAEIDNLTLHYQDQESFLHELIRSIDVYDLFAGFSTKGYVNKLRTVYDNPLLFEKLKLVKGNNIYDSKEIEKMIDLLTDIENPFSNNMFSDNAFFKSKRFQGLVTEIRKNKKVQLTDPCFELARCIFDDSFELKQELKKYPVYREVFRAKQKYLTKPISEPAKLVKPFEEEYIQPSLFDKK